MIRFSDPSAYGTAHIRLEVLLGLVLFLSREGIRGASLRHTDTYSQRPPQKMLILHLLPIGLGIIIGTGALPWFLSSATVDASLRSKYSQTVYLYLASAFAELLAEPLYLHALSEYGGRSVSLKVRAEGAAALIRGLTTLISIIVATSNSIESSRGAVSLISYGLGQFAYGATILAVFSSAYISRWGLQTTLSLYLPFQSHGANSKGDADFVISRTRQLAVVLSFQSVLKFLATEADKLAISFLGGPEDQGGYALGVNYASLPLRLLFQPLEESARLQFSRASGDIDPSQQKQSARTADASSGVEKPNLQASFVGAAASTHPKKLAPSAAGIRQLDAKASGPQDSPGATVRAFLQLHIFIGLLTVCYLPPLSETIIRVLSGPQWVATSAPRTLSSFAYFLPVAGISGILEGFVQSTASEQGLKRYNQVIMMSSAGFVVALFAFSMAGIFSPEEALVFSSALSMLIRATAGWIYVSKVFRNTPLGSLSLLPLKETTLLITLGGLLARWASSEVLKSAGTPLDGTIRHHAPIILTTGALGLASLISL